jgi:hypothetical protein
MGSIIPPDGMSAACAQVYILDSAEQVETRQALPWGASLDSNLLTSLGDMLQTHNVLVQHFKAAAELDAPNLQVGQTVYVNENANNLFHLPLPSILPHFLPALVSLPWSPFPPTVIPGGTCGLLPPLDLRTVVATIAPRRQRLRCSGQTCRMRSTQSPATWWYGFGETGPVYTSSASSTPRTNSCTPLSAGLTFVEGG